MATTTIGVRHIRPGKTTGLFSRLLARLFRARAVERRIEDLSDAELMDIGIEPHMMAQIQELRHWSSPHRADRTAWTDLMLRPPYG